MSTANLDAYNLAQVNVGGLIREDVMDEIWDISSVPLPFTDRIGSTRHDNMKVEWTTDDLGNPDNTNANVDGADAGADQSSTGARVANQTQLPDHVIKVSMGAQASNTIGFQNTLEYQVSRGQQKIRRDVTERPEHKVPISQTRMRNGEVLFIQV